MLTSLPSLLIIPFILLGGKLTEKVDFVRILKIGLWLFAASGILYLISNKMWQLIVVSALLGIGFTGFTVNINDRRILRGMLESMGFAADTLDSVCITFDKMDKIGAEGVKAELTEKQLPENAINALADFIAAGDVTLDAVAARCADPAIADDLKYVLATANTLAAGRYQVAYCPSLVRGQGYYTGMVFEITCPQFSGAVAGGGRYDNMVGKFLGVQVPAVGFSIGFERVCGILLEQGYQIPGAKQKIALLYGKDTDFPAVLSKAAALREQYNVTVLPQGKKLGKQLGQLEAAGFAGADLENLVNEAALLAARRNRKAITMEDIEEASMKVMAGPEKKSRVVSERARRLTAYHESGHAIASFFLKNSDPVHYITIIPRGAAGGFTWYRKAEDAENFTSRGEMFDSIVSALGGRIAERLFLDDISTGASNDIQQATNIARDMVMKYGMSEKLGPISFDDSSHSIFIGRDFGTTKSYSEETAATIDEEVKHLFDQAYAKCEALLREHADLLTGLAEYLLIHETIEGDDFRYYCEHGVMPVHPDDTIEPPAKVIRRMDEAPETPQPEAEAPAQPEAPSAPDADAPNSDPGEQP